MYSFQTNNPYRTNIFSTEFYLNKKNVLTKILVSILNYFKKLYSINCTVKTFLIHMVTFISKYNLEESMWEVFARYGIG